MSARPSRFAVILVRTAMLALPAGDVRRRWEAELTAELYGLSIRHQIGFAVMTLLTAWSLRHVLSRTSTGAKMIISRPRKPLGCKLNLRHHYLRQSTEDGDRYWRCARCGKDRYDGPYVSGIGIASVGPRGG